MCNSFATKLQSLFGLSYYKFIDVELKQRALKVRKDRTFRSSVKYCKSFSNVDNSVKSALNKWILSHLHINQSPITNYDIQVKLYDGNGETETELRHKVIFQVPVCELHILQKGFLCISDSDI